MYLNVKIEDHSFRVSVGSGHNDWAWLGHYAARRFSKISYPQGTYLPAQLHLVDKQNQKFLPHPREKINLFLEQNKLAESSITVIVKIRKGNHTPTDFEKIWQSEAYGMERMMMNVVYVVDSDKFKNKEGEKDMFFRVLFHYSMHPDIRHMFSDKKYNSPIEIELEQTRIDSKSSQFKTHLKLPFGDITAELLHFWRDPKDPTSYRSQKIKDIELKMDSLKVSLHTSPKYIAIEQINERVGEQMRVTENITKSLQEKQLQAKKRNANASLCCFSFEQFWKLLEEEHADELLLDNYDKSTKQRLKVSLEKSLNDLYEIFFYYFIIQNQSKEKKQELAITYQHVMHFLRFYDVFSDMEALNNFLEYYNNDFKFKTIKDTVDVQKKGVKFVQFVVILLRAIQFIQTSTFMVKGETFDSSVTKAIENIIEKDEAKLEYSEFKLNIRQNPKIISFFRNNADTLKQVFVNQITNSVQKAGDKYLLMKEEFKSLLELSALSNKNTDAILQDLFEELNLPEEGIYYYEFIEAIQWLALALVSSDKDQGSADNSEEEALLIIEKIKFFIEKVQL